MKQLSVVALVLLLALSVHAQAVIQGKVVDAETDEPLIGTTVILKGTQQGTTTDIEGRFALKVPPGIQTLVISFTGYKSRELTTRASQGGTDVGVILLEPTAVGLKEVEVIASVAIDRKTPVAVTTLQGREIEEIVGNQEFPEVLRKAPSVYVTKQGGGFGDSRINIRGFDQRNTAVMINGVPVNDMENGWVYWSNWAGLSDVTSRIDYQRGLGASKLVVPSVGGSINIVTNAAAMKKGGSFSITAGNDGYQKYGAVFHTGVSSKGLAFSGQITHTRGNGYVDGTKFRAYSYFFSLTQKVNDAHTIAATFLGAPQWHHQRFIPGRYDGVTLRTFYDPDNTGKPRTNLGIRYNWLWGHLNGEEFTWRRNFYHKPIGFINHYWTISDKTDIKTSLYVSLGNGGGTGPRGRINTSGGRIYPTSTPLYDANWQIMFDSIVAWNKGKPVHAFDTAVKAPEASGPYAGKYITTKRGNGMIRRASMNYHQWYGIYSTLTHAFTDKISLITGIDGRYYIGKHFRRVENLLGNDAYLSTADVNNPQRYIDYEEPAVFGNFYNKSFNDPDNPNILNYHNDGVVSWMGAFGQVEYSTPSFSSFVAVTLSNQGFKRIDYFNYDLNSPNHATPWVNFLGGTIKGGANYNLNEYHNIFVNAGYFSRQPIFDDVFLNFRNDINKDAANQVITAFEMGYGYRGMMTRINLNLYNTVWGNRQFDVTTRNNANEEILYHFTNVSETHRGVELEAGIRPHKMVEVNAMLSVGDWFYNSNFSASGYNLDQNKPEDTTLTIYAKGLKVGDAAQTTANLELIIRPVKGLKVRLNYFYADNLYARYDVTDDKFLNPGGKVVKLPAYGLLDGGISYRLKAGKFPLTLRANMYNILDTRYVSEVATNIEDDPSTPNINEFYDNRGVFGFGRTWTVGLKLNF